MGIDYYSCEICGTAFPDVIHYGHCGKCEATLCGDCYDEMREKNGELGEDHERASWYGEEAPVCCDACDKAETENIKQELFERVVKFMKDNDITCEETIYQTDHVIENAYEFMSDLFKIIEPTLEIEKDED